LLLLAACGAPAKQDPKAPAMEPAVISVPRAVQPPTSSSPAQAMQPLIPKDPSQRLVAMAQGYSLVAAMMVHQDVGSLVTMYEKGAALTVPETTITGSSEVAKYMSVLARRRSLSDFQRLSRGSRVVDDSTLIDSGTFVMTLKRNPADSVLERGNYTTTWRARGGSTQGMTATQWTILDDRIGPGTVAKRKAGK
jgi:hypothetical protein